MRPPPPKVCGTVCGTAHSSSPLFAESIGLSQPKVTETDDVKRITSICVPVTSASRIERVADCYHLLRNCFLTLPRNSICCKLPVTIVNQEFGSGYLLIQILTLSFPLFQPQKQTGNQNDLFRIIKTLPVMPVGDQLFQPFRVNPNDLSRVSIR